MGMNERTYSIIANNLAKVAQNTQESNQHLETLVNNISTTEKSTLSNLLSRK